MARLRIVLFGVVAAIAAACGPGTATTAPTTVAATAAPTQGAVVTAAPTPDACATANLKTLAAGVLTVGTDNPAYPPYFNMHDSPYPSPWEDLGYTGDPTSGEGFESAIAYSVATQLGFTKDKVNWVAVPFANSFAPGPKTFDIFLNQVSYKPERAESADLSDGYYNLKQAIVALKSNPASKATTIAELAQYKFGAQIGTTSYDAIKDEIQATAEGAVFDTNDLAITALKNKQIDAIVVDLPTADYITNVQIEDSAAVIVGQLPGAAGSNEHFSLVLAKDSTLTPCVNAALAALNSAGTLDELAKKWLPFQEAIPVLK
ncbi:MAG TPA: ABC transporter substrate-binding protein [Candidatus Limnocylindrales bacterium]|nr:ABC transporter substrate-binding protein [Candidatus Limnocylindrales bacterium]